MATTERDNLAAAVQTLRAELDLTQEELAERAGINPRTVQRIENGEPVRARTLGGIDRAAGWPPGTAKRVAEGATPPKAVQPDRGTSVEGYALVLYRAWRTGGPDDLVDAINELTDLLGADTAHAAELRVAEMINQRASNQSRQERSAQ